ncbi:MAG: hypothetical protein AAF333_10245 [Planctomycetota bacterium]
MAEVEVGTETENAASWSYDVSVFDAGRVRRHTVTLSYQDYDLWCRGRVSPSRVVEAAFRFLLQNEPAEEIAVRFDCSVIRRHFPAVDVELPKLV